MLGLQGVGNFLGSDSAEETAVGACLGGDLHHQVLQLSGDGLGLSLLGLHLGLLGLVLHDHLVHVVGVGGDSQLLGEEEVAGVAVGNFNQLTTLAVALHVLLQNNFHDMYLQK